MKHLVVIGSATKGLAFVGPFDTEPEGMAYVDGWKSRHHGSTTPIGVVILHDPTDLKAGEGLK